MSSTFDLNMQRTLPVTCDQVWAAWTNADQLTRWLCPDPYQATDFNIELYPGGAFCFRIVGPNNERFDTTGCYLEVHPARRLVWTTALAGGYRPQPTLEFPPNFTCVLTLEPVTLTGGADGCLYTVRALHASADAAQKHAEMGFTEGWSVAADQLVAMVQGRR